MSIKFIVVTLVVYDYIMTLSVLEYAKMFPCKGKVLSRQAIIKRCTERLLPSDHHARKMPGNKGVWVIDVPDKDIIPEIKITSPSKPDMKTINRRHFNFN